MLQSSLGNKRDSEQSSVGENNRRMENRPYLKQFWGKADRNNPSRIHLLEHHLADVAACLEVLLKQPIIQHNLAHTAGREDLDDTTVARLCLLAAIHDIGKVNIGFQTQIWRGNDFPEGQRRPDRAGHTLDLIPVLKGDDCATAKWFSEALDWWGDATELWDDCGGETVSGLLIAVLSHHGRPLSLAGNRSDPQIWKPFELLAPREYVVRIGWLTRTWFTAAFAAGAPPLPAAPAFQHHFLGLCNLADWIGSNETWFPYDDKPRDDYIVTARKCARAAIDAIGLNITAQRKSIANAGVPNLTELFPNITVANAIQEATQQVPLNEQLIIVESETGSGKTEAALWRFARMYEAELVDGLYFALPTRAAAIQIHGRVKRFIAKLFSAHRPPVVLAVPGYEPGTNAAGVALPDYDWAVAGENDHDRPWAAEHPKRYLTAQIAVGTVDQAMLGALQVKNAHMRAAGLSRNLLVVDEVHASDTYMSIVLEQLLNAHINAGGYALLMSATLGSAARLRWLCRSRRTSEIPCLPQEDAINTAYPAVTTPGDTTEAVTSVSENDQRKHVQITARQEIHEFALVAQRALKAARAGAKVLVVRNTVDYAIKTQEALEELTGPSDARRLFTIHGKPTLHHGRFATADRQLLDAEVEWRLGKDKPRSSDGHIIVGTQTLEQSLDIDADLLVTDLCPMDVLLQRIGRLHRHERNDRPDGYTTPTCTVLTPPNNDLTSLLKPTSKANGLGPHGHVYEDVRMLEATRRLIDEYPLWRIPEMNRELVERATHSQALEAITQGLGEDWQAHTREIQGGKLGDGQTARALTIRRDSSFLTHNRDVVFVSSDEKIRTRLGDDRVDVVLDPPQPSPFDDSQQIDKLALSVHWLPPNEVLESVPPVPTGDGFEFSIGEYRYRYDRLGQRRL